MDTGISEDTLAFMKRTNEIRMAKMCRLCLQEQSLVNINIDQHFRRVLTEGNAKFLPNDRNFPQFVCEDCRKMTELLYRFNQRRNRSARLIRAYIERGGAYPEAKLLDDRKIVRSEKRPAEKDQLEGQNFKKARTMKDENGNDMKSKDDYVVCREVKMEKPSSKVNNREPRKSASGYNKDDRSLHRELLEKSVRKYLSKRGEMLFQ